MVIWIVSDIGVFSDNKLVKFLSHNAVFYDRMRSSMRHNVWPCCENVNVSL